MPNKMFHVWKDKLEIEDLLPVLGFSTLNSTCR